MNAAFPDAGAQALSRKGDSFSTMDIPDDGSTSDTAPSSSIIHKLDFKVIAYTGYDEEYPPRRLQASHSPNSKGWQSQRLCTYPQELVFRLADVYRIRRLQLLMHQYKIASKISIFVGLSLVPIEEEPLSVEDIQFQHIGHLSFSRNSKSEYKARELLSAHLDAHGDTIKLVIHGCHSNDLNMYNQVGIVAMSIFGYRPEEYYAPGAPGEAEELDLEHIYTRGAQDLANRNKIAPLLSIVNQHNAKIPMTEDLGFEMYQDSYTAKLIKDMTRAKEKAVREERYVFAKHLKRVLSIVHELGAEIAQYDVAKQKAVQEENYDTAEDIKVQINQLRAAVKRKMELEGIGYDQNGAICQQQQIIGAIQQTAQPFARQLEPWTHESLTEDRPKDFVEEVNASLPLPPAVSSESSQPQPVMNIEPEAVTKQISSSSLLSATSAPSVGDDERPIQPAIQLNYETVEEDQEVVEKMISPLMKKDSLSAPEDQLALSIENLLTAIPLTPTQRNAVTEAISVYSEETISSLFSKDFSIRVMAFSEVVAKLQTLDHEDKGHVVDATCQVICQGIMDNRERIFQVTIDLWKKLFDYVKTHHVSVSRLATLNRNTFPEMLNKVGDTKPNIRMLFLEFIAFICRHFHTHYSHNREFSVFPLILHASSEGKAKALLPRIILGRLELLTSLIDEYSASLEECLPVADLVDYLLPALTHANNTIRDAAVKIMKTLYQKTDGVEVATAFPSLSEKAIATIQNGVAKDQVPIWTSTELLKLKKPPVPSRSSSPEKKTRASQVKTAPAASHARDKKKLIPGTPPETMISESSGSEAAAIITTASKASVNKVKSQKTAKAKVVSKRAKSAGAPPMAKTTQPEFPMFKNDTEMKLLKEQQELESRIAELQRLQAAEETEPESVNEDTTHMPVTSGVSEDDTSVPRSPDVLSDGEPEPTKRIQTQRFNKKALKAVDHPQKPIKNDWNIDKTCIFCDEHDYTFNEQRLDEHYWKECPMLCQCPYCQVEVVEVAKLNHHILNDCEQRSKVKACPRCKEGIPIEQFKKHVLMRKCDVHKPSARFIRCPMCHIDVPNRQHEWKAHLLTNGGCKKSLRRPKSNATRMVTKSSEEGHAVTPSPEMTPIRELEEGNEDPPSMPVSKARSSHHIPNPPQWRENPEPESIRAAKSEVIMSETDTSALDRTDDEGETLSVTENSTHVGELEDISEDYSAEASPQIAPQEVTQQSSDGRLKVPTLERRVSMPPSAVNQARRTSVPVIQVEAPTPMTPEKPAIVANVKATATPPSVLRRDSKINTLMNDPASTTSRRSTLQLGGQILKSRDLSAALSPPSALASSPAVPLAENATDPRPASGSRKLSWFAGGKKRKSNADSSALTSPEPTVPPPPPPAPSTS